MLHKDSKVGMRIRDLHLHGTWKWLLAVLISPETAERTIIAGCKDIFTPGTTPVLTGSTSHEHSVAATSSSYRQEHGLRCLLAC